MLFETPVLFLVFNRPDHTARVFGRIREVRPKYLFVAADGPRTSHPEDQEKCNKVREVILKGVDWDCELITLFRDDNLGCGRGPAEAITWFFEQVEEGIILEDDCLPNLVFFNFCSELLCYYRGNDQIMHIGGSNFQQARSKEKYSYYFSAYSHNWGWATWRNRWLKFKYFIDRPDIPSLIDVFEYYGFKKVEMKYWLKVFNTVNESRPKDIWDYQWLNAIWMNRGLSIIPNANLVRNIGFDSEGTHTNENHDFFSLPTGSLNSIQHPNLIKVNKRADRYTFENYYSFRTPLTKKLLSILRSIF